MSAPILTLGILLVCVLCTMLLFVGFGQFTVRKLRKNPATREALGLELMSGWDIINVAQALALPAGLMARFRNTRLSFLYADAALLTQHTTRFDRLLAKAFYWLLMFTGMATIVWVGVEVLGLW